MDLARDDKEKHIRGWQILGQLILSGGWHRVPIMGAECMLRIPNSDVGIGLTFLS
jgi:hypothetical protein